MSNVSELESRIAAALTRIGSGVEKLSADSGVDAAALQKQLEEERVANAQLEERVKVLKDRQDTKIADLETRVAAQSDQMAQLDAELQRLRASNADMRELNGQLRTAADSGVTDPELINRAMMAEVEALNTQRAAEAAEVDAILSELKPLIEEV